MEGRRGNVFSSPGVTSQSLSEPVLQAMNFKAPRFFPLTEGQVD